MEDRERALGDARVADEPTRALRRANVVLLVLMWTGALAAWPALPERIPIHFDASLQPDRWVPHDAGGFLVWLLLPVFATLTSLILQWAGGYAARHPVAWSIPSKAEFLALSDEARAPIVLQLRRMVGRVALLTTTVLALAQAATWLTATGYDRAASVLLAVMLVFLVLIFAVAIDASRRTKRMVLQAGSESGAARSVVAFVALLAIGACACVAPNAAEAMPVRAGMTPASLQDTAFIGRLARTDSALSARLREIVATSGWPDADRVGRDAVHAAFLIVQHTPFDEFREAVLPHVERDARAGVLGAQDYAVFIDRVRTHRGDLQLYGTQYSLVGDVLARDPVADPAGLDERRAQLGLMPIAEYERMLGEFYGATVRSE